MRGLRLLLLAALIASVVGVAPSGARPTAEGHYIAGETLPLFPRHAMDPTGTAGTIGIGGFVFPGKNTPPRRIRIVDDVTGTNDIGVWINFQESVDPVGYCTDEDGWIEIRNFNPPARQDITIEPLISPEPYVSCVNSATTGTIIVEY